MDKDKAKADRDSAKKAIVRIDKWVDNNKDLETDS